MKYCTQRQWLYKKHLALNYCTLKEFSIFCQLTEMLVNSQINKNTAICFFPVLSFTSHQNWLSYQRPNTCTVHLTINKQMTRWKATLKNNYPVHFLKTQNIIIMRSKIDFIINIFSSIRLHWVDLCSETSAVCLEIVSLLYFWTKVFQLVGNLPSLPQFADVLLSGAEVQAVPFCHRR